MFKSKTINQPITQKTNNNSLFIVFQVHISFKTNVGYKNETQNSKTCRFIVDTELTIYFYYI